MIKGELAHRVQTLTDERLPFVIATVVRARRPTSVRPGDSAVILADGTIEGFVGGACAESTVRLYSLRVLETGEPLLLRLVPDEGSRSDADDAIDGAVVEHNPCLSGGALEIFLEPQLPAARIVIVGSAPIATALAGVAGAAGYDIVRGAAEDVRPTAGDAAMIVAAHGTDEQRVLAQALTAGVPYVALVASAKRGEAVRAELDVPDELRAQLHTPAGLDIGARTPAEIAISILAELVAQAHAHPGVQAGVAAKQPAGAGVAGARAGVAAQSAAGAEVAGARAGVAARSAATAIDPICGMQVAVTGASVFVELEGGERVYFCGTGCRDAHAAQHARHGATS